MNIEQYTKYFRSEYENITISTMTVTDGNIIVADPFTGIYNDIPSYTQKLSAGQYDVNACIARKGDDVRIAAVEVVVTNKEPDNFSMALNGSESPEELAELAEDEYFGFPVDAGLASIFDKTSLVAYMDFENKWYEQNPDKNLYDDFFSELFEKSYINSPNTQREGGDYIDFVIPGTEYHIPMFASGFGDGYYPVFFGYSNDGKICRIVILFIDLDN